MREPSYFTREEYALTKVALAREEVPAAAATADTRHPAAVAAAPAAGRALTLRLLAALVIRELARLRVLFVVARSHRTWRHRAARRERPRWQRSALRRAEALSAAASASTAAATARELVRPHGSGPGLHRALVAAVYRSALGASRIAGSAVRPPAIGGCALGRAGVLWSLVELFHGHAPLRRTRSQRVPSLVSFTRIP